MDLMNKETRLKIAVALGIAILFGLAYGMQTKDAEVVNDIPSGEYVSPTDGAAPTDARGVSAEVPVPAPRQASFGIMDGSARVGTVTLTDLAGNNTRIVITMSRADKDETLPANVHAGTCTDTAQEVQYPLNPVVKGTSVTVLNVNIGALTDKAPQSIRIKSDAVDANAPLAGCGNLR